MAINNFQTTFNTEIFENLNAPALITTRLEYGHGVYPHGDFFNKTLYKHINPIDGDMYLLAFRILAWAFNGREYYWLIQKPNEKPSWVKSFIVPSTMVFTSVDEYLNYANGDKNVKSAISWSMRENLFWDYRERFGEYVKIQKSWTMKNGQAVQVESKISYLCGFENGIFVGLSLKNNEYATKEECLRTCLNGMQVIDFEEEPIHVEVNINVLPNKPRVRTLVISEE